MVRGQIQPNQFAPWRGASWRGGYPDGLLSSYRNYLTPDSRYYGVFGFRCVLVSGSGG